MLRGPALPLTALALLLAAAPSAPAPIPQHEVRGARLPEGLWRYEIRVAGGTVGTLSAQTRRQDGELVSRVVVSGGDRQETTVVMHGSSLLPVRSRTLLEGADGRRFEAELTYEVTGDSLRVTRHILQQVGSGEDRYPAVTVWRTSAHGAFDLAQLDLVIASLPLKAGASWGFLVLDPTADAPVPIRLQVLESRMRTVPAGRFEVWRVRVRGLALESLYEVDTAGRQLVLQQIPGQQVTVVLMGGGSRGSSP